MRNPTKGNAACWDCKWYLTWKGQFVCTLPDHEKVFQVMPMKCEYRQKAK